MAPIFLVNPSFTSTKISPFERFGIGNNMPAEMDDLLVSIYNSSVLEIAQLRIPLIQEQLSTSTFGE